MAGASGVSLQSSEEPCRLRHPQISGSPRVKRILFVSRQFPQDIVRSVHGVYIRMRVFTGRAPGDGRCPRRCSSMSRKVSSASPAAMQQAEADMRSFWGHRVPR